MYWFHRLQYLFLKDFFTAAAAGKFTNGWQTCSWHLCCNTSLYLTGVCKEQQNRSSRFQLGSGWKLSSYLFILAAEMETVRFKNRKLNLQKCGLWVA